MMILPHVALDATDLSLEETMAALLKIFQETADPEWVDVDATVAEYDDIPTEDWVIDYLVEAIDGSDAGDYRDFVRQGSRFIWMADIESLKGDRDIVHFTDDVRQIYGPDCDEPFAALTTPGYWTLYKWDRKERHWAPQWIAAVSDEEADQ